LEGQGWVPLHSEQLKQSEITLTTIVMSKNILITTVPFGENDRKPLELLESANISYLVNPLGKKLTEGELSEMVSDVDAIIAGTEPITEFVMSKAPRLKMISRVGIGLDSVDLLAAQKRGIMVSYTPEAPAPAVADLTVGLMLSLLRRIHVSNNQMHQGTWQRYFGRRISEVTIGMIGVGRIGKQVLDRLQGFGKLNILANDISPDLELDQKFQLKWVTKEEIYREADVISFHLPLTHKTRNLIGSRELETMKSDAVLINTSRGGIVNEDDLYVAMSKGHLLGAALDVFVNEPYAGKLGEIERCLLTSHMGSMSVDCRTQMEIEATEEAVRFFQNRPLLGEVPAEEYQMRKHL